MRTLFFLSLFSTLFFPLSSLHAERIQAPDYSSLSFSAPLSRIEGIKRAQNARTKLDFKRPAKQLFGGHIKASIGNAYAYGSYSRGCMAGSQALAIDGKYWQAMRLSRNRNWGHPRLIETIQKLAIEGAQKDGWNGLLVGDLSQPRGGSMLTGHASHQIGLDGDIWLTPMPDKRLNRQEREEISAISMLKQGTRTIDPTIWSDAHARIIRRAALQKDVARLFVHPAIKEQLCRFETGDRQWLRKVRPWYGHHYHFHIRLKCPEGSKGCKNQTPPPAGDGCGKTLQ